MKKNQHFLVVGGGVAGIAVSKHFIDQSILLFFVA